MSDHQKPGSIGWIDLTVDDADGLKDFYAGVAGWESTGLSMGDYEDYCVGPPGEDPVAGICHARGANAGLPPQWLIYIVVADIEASVERCEALGGRILQPLRAAGHSRIAIVEDPSGAAFALYETQG